MNRHYGMDWLRIVSFAALIVIHAVFFFAPEPWGFPVKRPEIVEWTGAFIHAFHPWRMPLLYAVSGYASAALFARDPQPVRFLIDRLARLLIPTAFAILAIIPPQLWLMLRLHHGYTETLWTFWTRDWLSFTSIGGVALPNAQHMWFVEYLWIYTLWLVALLLLPAAWRAAARVGAERLLSGARFLWLPIALLLARVLWFWPGPLPTYNVLSDTYMNLVYFPMFGFGFALRNSPALWREIARWWRPSAALALLSLPAIVGIELAWPAHVDAPGWLQAAYALSWAVMGWTGAVALLGIADRYWQRDHRWRPVLAEAVFPFYLIHQTVIVAACALLYPLGLPGLAEFALLLVAAAAGCWGFYRFGRDVPVLRYLIGLKGWMPPARRPLPAPAPAAAESA
ncbi:MAG: acyltransferase family protein [Novosphingobium sp.]